MKKIILILVLFFGIKIVSAAEVGATPISYYVKVNGSDKIIVVQKIHELKNKNVLFNLDINNYGITPKMLKDNDYLKLNYDSLVNKINEFNTIVYYGYNNTEKKDLNYFLTQVLIWQIMGDVQLDIVDKLGNVINDFDEKINEIKEIIDFHNKDSEFFNKNYIILYGKTLNLEYQSPILENPIIENFTFENIDNNLNVTVNKIGKYEINLEKDYENENYIYTDGFFYVWHSSLGPGDLNKTFTINVKGINLSIKENLIGINNKFGDAILNSKYELYFKDDLINTFKTLNNLEIIPHSSYQLKDISEDVGIQNIDIINFEVLDKDYVLNIDKYVINKKINISITDNNKYYIYLKSNNELYEIVDKNSNSIILPYGLYYIKDEDSNYYKELEVFNGKEEVLKIESDKVLEESIEDNTVIEEVKDENNINNDLYQDIVDNPKTSDNLYVSIVIFILSNLVIILIIHVKKYI